MTKDYYEILGVAKGTSPEEIKKAYRKKAHQYHPDKAGGNEAKFKELNEAYQVLGNAEKRKQYDQFGTTFDQQGGGFNWSDFGNAGFDPFRQGGFRSENIKFDFGDIGDIFGDIFGTGRSSRARSRRVTRGQDIEMELEINFREAVFGTEKTVELYKTVTCDKCEGTGAEPGSKIITCSTCQGSGQVDQIQRTILGQIRSRAICPDCQGEGKTYSKKCSRCRGTGVIKDTQRIKVNIPAGIDNGQTIRLSGEGEMGPKGGPAGDLFISIRVKLDPEFRRQGSNILSQIKINFAQAVLGAKIKANTLEGEGYLKIPAGTPSGKIFKLKGKGVPQLHSRSRGDQLVEVIVKIPERLSREQKKLIEKLAELE
ncbi:MAG: molecular chaperone DnaJ [Candidatus Kerfeldbacteria bacterium CG08_land_8_20_14_0_20_40_16]|uniref:Chaperone protein DnaJ n=1 Tax=Candidatus Kerfeldbacteria bacterium CG08_land_8_20_14_0_20_40_16 TaxID=2014244 RepID=A0A2H0YV53_9BACT|nr:MAG: molecular chaperone DnaJ [Candidatus Kerfeldbacteria bacterium CG08_land_8_20_14_0_20_40_16]